MYAAVDIGGTKTLIAVFDSSGSIIEQVKFPTPPNYDDFILEVANNVAELATKDFQSVGVAAPGKIDHKNGTMIAAGNLAWKNAPIQHDLTDVFNAPVIFENDAKTAALAEAIAAGSKYSTVVYITVSTGIGIGVCENQKLDRALEDAEVGWMSVEYKGQILPWEKIASGSAIVKQYGKRASEIDDKAIWDEISSKLALGLISVIAIIQPDLIVFGGGVGSHLDKFKEPLVKHLKRYENPMVPIPPIIKSSHPEEAVVYGCYQLAKQFSEANA